MTLLVEEKGMQWNIPSGKREEGDETAQEEKGKKLMYMYQPGKEEKK
jgi:nitrous oxide reductase